LGLATRRAVMRYDSIWCGRIRNSAPDPIRIAIHRGSDTSDVPGEMIGGGMMQAERGGDAFDTFWPYRFSKPVSVPAGDYWLVVSQLGLDNMAVGADISRSGFDMIVSGDSPKYEYIHRSPYGTQYDTTKNSGDISRAIAFEVPAGSGNWKPFKPEYGKVAEGFAWSGSYIPMIRPLVGNGKLVASVRSKAEVTSVTAYPNPFKIGNDIVMFSSQGHRQPRGAVITNMLGQQIRTFKHMDPLEWDGKDDNGKPVRPGAYIVHSDENESLLLIAQ
jgi:hypothetical protein